MIIINTSKRAASAPSKLGSGVIVFGSVGRLVVGGGLWWSWQLAGGGDEEEDSVAQEAQGSAGPGFLLGHLN